MGYDTERFPTQPKEDLICPICQGVLEDPIECSICQTNFCTTCINMWLAKNNICPNLCELKLQRSHKYLKSDLDNLSMTCDNFEFGCKELVKLEFLKKHVDSECKFRKTMCPNQGCTEEYFIFDEEIHQNNCIMRRVKCKECGEEMNFSEAVSHKCIRYLAKQLNSLVTEFRVAVPKISKIKERFSEVQYQFTAKCAECKENPIKGSRYICLNCADYSLCWKCNNTSKHVHKNLYQLYRECSHENITCDGCLVTPLPSVRFKCKKCADFGIFYLDFCVICKNTKEHLHNDFDVWAPFDMLVKPAPIVKQAYFPGEKLVRKWVLYNEGNDPIRNFFITLVAGTPCSNNLLSKFYFF